jgi:hypothetical protein
MQREAIRAAILQFADDIRLDNEGARHGDAVDGAAPERSSRFRRRMPAMVEAVKRSGCIMLFNSISLS